MFQSFKRVLISAAIAVAVLPAVAADKLKIAVVPGAYADSINAAAKDAKAQGIEVEVIEFTDWTTPNTALDAGDIDINYFQHQAFLDNAIRDRGYKIESVGLGLLPNIGLYSKKHAALADIPVGASVGVANDPVNQARGLLLLQTAGLIQLRPGVGAKASVNDVVGNPRKLKLLEVEGPQLVRALDDVALAQGYPAHLVNAGQRELASRALLYSTVDDLYYAIRFVARSDRKQDPRIAQFVQLYQASPAVAKQISASFADDPKLYSLPWKNAAKAAP